MEQVLCQYAPESSQNGGNDFSRADYANGRANRNSPPAFSERLRLPVLMWAVWIRLSMYFDRKTREEIKRARFRISEVFDHAFGNHTENVLIVSHAALMVFMREELIRRGFAGPKFKIAKNGELYVFEKPPC